MPRSTRDILFVESVRDGIHKCLGVTANNVPLPGSTRALLKGPLQQQVRDFTSDRTGHTLTNYADAKRLAAYAAYFGVRAYFLVQEFVAAFGLESNRILDIGAGVGSAAIAAAKDLATVQITLVEPNKNALRFGEQLCRAVGVGNCIAIGCGVQSLASRTVGKVDLILMVNTVNEWAMPLSSKALTIAKLLQTHAPSGHVLIIEPAMRQVSRELSQLRDELVAQGVFIQAPCTHMNPCPMLSRRRDFCHGHLLLDVPEDFVAVGHETMNLTINDADFAYLLCSLSPPQVQSCHRVVGDLRREKGRNRLFLCGDTGLVESYALTRSGSKAAAALDDFVRGDVVELDPPATADRYRIDEPGQIRHIKTFP